MMPAGADNPDQEIVDEAFKQALLAIEQAHDLIEAAEVLGGKSEHTTMAKSKLAESRVWLNEAFVSRVFASSTNGHGGTTH